MEPVSALGGNPTTPAGSLVLEWDRDRSQFPQAASAEIGTNHLDNFSDLSAFNRISADVRVSDPDVPLSIFFWDEDTHTGFGTPTRKVGVRDTWQTLSWDVPWPPSFDRTDVDEIKFVVNGIDDHRVGRVFFDNVALVSATLPDPVAGLPYDFATFDVVPRVVQGKAEEERLTDFGNNWGELLDDYVTTATDTTGGGAGSPASLRVEYALPPNSFTGMFFSLWGHADYKQTQTLNLADIDGDLAGAPRDVEQIQFWVRGSGRTTQTHNVKIELKDATDSFDRTAYRYITIDDADTTWQRVALDADVTNASFWSYNVAPAAQDDVRLHLRRRLQRTRRSGWHC